MNSYLKVKKFNWVELGGITVICIPAVGNYEQFVDDNFAKSNGFYNPKTKEFTSYQDFYKKKLENGKCLYHKKYLIFKAGYHEKYLKYAEEFFDDISKNKKDSEILNDLADATTYTLVSNTLKIVKRGVFSKEFATERLSKYFKDKNLIQKYI